MLEKLDGALEQYCIITFFSQTIESRNESEVQPIQAHNTLPDHCSSLNTLQRTPASKKNRSVQHDD